MKITKVDVFEVHTRRPAWRPVLCRIYTDEGIYGDGEAALAYGTAAPAAAGMIRDLATLIIGMDPLDNEVIWDKLYKSTFWGQNGGPVVFSGISALDIALWDIKGKYFRASALPRPFQPVLTRWRKTPSSTLPCTPPPSSSSAVRARSM